METYKINFYILLITYFTTIISCGEINFNGIPAAFGDLDLNRRTDIVVISEDGRNLTVLYQHEPQQISQHFQSSYSCRLADKIAQVYITDIDSDGKPNLLVLLEKHIEGLVLYDLVNLGLPDATSSEHELCKWDDLKIRMLSQPFLLDIDGDLRTDFMGIGVDGKVSVWKSRDVKNMNASNLFIKVSESEWFASMPLNYLAGTHSNSFIDISGDGVADIILSSKENSRVTYMYATPDKKAPFVIKRTIDLTAGFDYGQSSLVDINADGRVDHLIPRCNSAGCELIIIYENGSMFSIFSFQNTTANFDYRLDTQKVGSYVFPVMLRASDLDGDGYTDFVAVAKDKNSNRNRFDVIYLHNIPAPPDPLYEQIRMNRSFEIVPVQLIHNNSTDDMKLVTLFDINEDGKVDMLIGGVRDSSSEPRDLVVRARKNDQMTDACFMKVLVTNGHSDGGVSYGQSARGPTVCFELSQNDGKKMQGCAGQQAQASYFALQQPYVIFGLGQTPHFVEKLMVTIPGFGADFKDRTRQLEQIVPDAQIIIIPRERANPLSWDYKMFLSPMTELVPPTLIALAVICVFLLIMIYFLHRQETIEDAAEHEEYKRHWPECKG